MSFVHLHLHTQYSLLDGANKVDALIPRVKELRMPAVAMTDHGNMFGAVHFYKKAIEIGVKPILGCEVYVAPKSRFDRVGRAEDYEAGGNHHLTLLAITLEGYKHLCRLVTAGYTEGFYYKPRIDKDILREWSGGLVALSGCLSSEVAEALKGGSLERARRVVEEYARIFPGRYYLEIQDNKLAAQAGVNRGLAEIGREAGIPLVATNDCHYLHPEDAKAHEVLLCVQSKKTRDDPDAWRLDTHELYVKSPDEMRAAFADFPEAVAATLEIASRADVELTFGEYQFPAFTTPAGQSLEEYLVESATRGLEQRLELCRARPDWRGETEAAYRARLEAELAIIRSMGFAGYFLIVADFIGEAKRRGIPVGPGRGSAAGSLVAYALRITDLDPIPYGLLFERFLNPERKSMPDIDVDFCYERRDQVIDYVRQKYGADRVAQIITFGTLKGKQAIKDVGRVLGFGFAETDRIAKLYPAPKQGRDYPLEEALRMEPRLREVRDRGPRERELFDYARRLEGLLRHASKHASGIVISNRPLVEELPLFVYEGNVVTQYSYHHVDAIGLIKFDFLGLKNVTLLANVVRRARQAKAVEVDLATLPLDDRATYQALSRGDVVGVFQLESSGMRKLAMDLKPSSFEDLIAVLALFRPGPLDAGMDQSFIKRKHGREPIRYLHPALEPILGETYGVILYQEQVMRIAQVLAGYTLGEADNLRSAMGKKKKDVMDRERVRFLRGAVERGTSPDLAAEIFGQMETFAAYGFNKSHSAAYALISYQTAYLKTRFPHEFLAALLTMEMGDAEKTYKNIADCREHGIRVLPPDINESREDFTVTGSDIRFGLGAVRDVGSRAIEAILAARTAPFTSLADFCRRVSGPLVNKRAVESLVKCGAFDSLGEKRARLFAGLEDAMRWAERVEREARSDQMGLFASGGDGHGSSDAPPLPDVAPWSDKELLRHEKEAIGFFITAHPLDKFRRDLARLASATTATLPARSSGDRVTLGGVIHTIRLKNSKKGERYATFLLEDQEGVVESIAWPDSYRKFETVIHGDDPVLLVGSLDKQEARATGGDDSEGPAEGALARDRCQVIVEEIRPLGAAREEAVRQVHLQLAAERLTEDGLRRLRDTLAEHPGKCPAYVHVIVGEQAEAVIELPRDLAVAPSEAMVDAVERLFGRGVAVLR